VVELAFDRQSPHLVVTGGAGFIGSEFVRRALGRNDGTWVAVLDKLTYASARTRFTFRSTRC
jgi:dTDP-glucose 4,6-dehydratase